MSHAILNASPTVTSYSSGSATRLFFMSEEMNTVWFISSLSPNVMKLKFFLEPFCS